MKRLKCLKEKLKGWHQYMFDDVRVKNDETLKEIEAIDRLDMEGLITSEDQEKKVSLK